MGWGRLGAVALAAFLACFPAAAPGLAEDSAGPAHVLHLPPDAFAEGGVLGGLEIPACRVALADGEGRSVLQVSPAMAQRGFPDLAFTFPPYRQNYDLGVGTVSVRVRIPGADAADAASTLRSSAFDLEVAGTSLRLTVRFESEGREFVGEYAADSALTGKVPWTHLLDVQADNLVVTADLPLLAQGMLPAIGEVSTRVEFDFAVAALGSAGVKIDSAAIKEHIASAARDGLRAFFESPGFRGGLSAALGALILGDPGVAGLPVRRIELVPAADGGLDVRILTMGSP